jgi:hypothetical protein
MLQWPVARFFLQGRTGITIFSFVTGYVCALRPIRQIRKGDREGALESITWSAMRRIPRLVIPATVATVIAWFLAQLGLFEVAKRTDSMWIGANTVGRSSDMVDALASLPYNLATTWLRRKNIYSDDQSTLLPLLRGGMFVYVFMMATTYVQNGYRVLLSLLMWFYFWMANDCKLADVSLDSYVDC